jgi:hypothetical protein
MDNQEMKDLQDPENWEELEAEVRQSPLRESRAVVSVAFPRDAFRQVAEYAESHGMKTSELIRKAALAFITSDPGAPTARIHSITSSSNFTNEYRVSSVSVSTGKSEVRESEPANYSTS